MSPKPDHPDDADEIVTEDGATVRPLVDILIEYRRGSYHEDLSRDLHDLIGEVVTVEKGGKLTIEIDVAYAGDMSVDLTFTTKTKIPQAPSPSARYFIDRHGNPTRDDPTSLPFPNND